LKIVAPSNIEVMFVTATVFQLLILWLNPVAPANIETIVVTAPVFQKFAERVKATPKLLNAVAP